MQILKNRGGEVAHLSLQYPLGKEQKRFFYAQTAARARSDDIPAFFSEVGQRLLTDLPLGSQIRLVEHEHEWHVPDSRFDFFLQAAHRVESRQTGSVCNQQVPRRAAQVRHVDLEKIILSGKVPQDEIYLLRSNRQLLFINLDAYGGIVFVGEYAAGKPHQQARFPHRKGTQYAYFF